MPSRDEVLRDLITRVTSLEEKVSDLENKANEGWDEEFDVGPEPGPEMPKRAMTIIELRDGVEVEIPRATEKQMDMRQRFIDRGGMKGLRSMKVEDAEKAFMVGGPIWLHAFDRDFVLTLPADARMLLCEDVWEVDQKAAGDLARDILKADDEDQRMWAYDSAEMVFENAES
jgi:hypothetical protein